MGTAEGIALLVGGLGIFVCPFVVSGWMFEYGRRNVFWFGLAAAAFCLWTLILAATRSPLDYSWATQWSIMAGLFIVPAIAGAIVSEMVLKRRNGE